MDFPATATNRFARVWLMSFNGCARSQLCGLLRVAALCLVPWLCAPALGQSTGDSTTGFVVSENRGGYIDSAVVEDQIRFRYDFASGITAGSRAEFLYTRPGSGPDSLPLAETNIRYQDITFILEHMFAERFSAILELPVRFLDPFQNESAQGMSDMSVAFKYALTEDAPLWTAQLRVYMPTGDADQGLGNNHVSLEPGLLMNRPLGNGWTLEGELRCWVAVGGGDLAGTVMRYGLGANRPFRVDSNLTISPVVEFVGWTVLDGAEMRPTEGMGVVPVDASGVTIVNGKFGARFDTHNGWDLYLGYGRVLTDQTWYEDLVRAEVRLYY